MCVTGCTDKTCFCRLTVATVYDVVKAFKDGIAYVKDIAYRALIRPKLEYASVIWSPWQQFLVDNIEKIQRRSARYVLNDYHSDSNVTAMINHLNWESLEDRRNKASLHIFYKMFNNLTTIPYIQYVQLSTVTSTRYPHPFKLISMLAKKTP